MHKRRICIVTGSRAEYGLLYWLMKEIQVDSDLDLQIIATGMHLSPEFGLTYRRIEEDGFKINEKVEMLLSSDTPVGIAKSVGLGVMGFADAFARQKPDIVVVLGDRFEIFSAAQAAVISKIPLAHIHGGETTEGAFDESFRHAITKMSHFHFTAAEDYRRRVIQLGEVPERVLNVGAPGLDSIVKLRLLSRTSLEKAIDFKLGLLSFLVTYQPVTLGYKSPVQSFKELLTAIDRFPDATVIFTKANADTAGRAINEGIDRYVEKNPRRAIAFTAMGQLLYLSAMKNTDIIIGNSSSGIIEAPSFHKPTVNIGPRQKGRLKADSVLDCQEKEQTITAAIRRGLSPEFKAILKNTRNPYGGGNASAKIKEFLKAVSLKNILMKKFHDVNGV